MENAFGFILNNVLLGVGLAMDAFSVSLANGLNEPDMRSGRRCLVAGTFGVFQAIMPLLGWFFVHTAAEKFETFRPLIPWIALILLLYIGGKMLIEGIRNKDEGSPEKLTLTALFVQGVATSIDALSVGFTIADYDAKAALLASFIIGVMTFAISDAGIHIGKRFGTKLANKASILGGVILIAIGIEIFIKGLLG